MTEWWMDPAIIVIAALLGWLLTNAISVATAYLLGPKRAKKLIVSALNDPESAEVKSVRHALIEPEIAKVEAQLASLKSSIPSAPNLDGIRAELQGIHSEVDSFRTDFDAMSAQVEAIPQKIEMTILSAKGVETRKVQAALAQAGAEIKDSINLEDAARLMDENAPDSNAVVARALIKDLAKMSVTDEFAAEHPGEAVLFKLIKAKGLQILSESALGAPSVGVMSTRTTRTAGPEPYGR